MADYTLVHARIPFGYDKKFRDRGEVFNLTGGRNDEKLIGMRYVLPVSKDTKTYMCDKCGRKFIAEGFYTAHKRKKDCNVDQGEPTLLETAELIGVDLDKLKVERESVEQRATDFSGEIK